MNETGISVSELNLLVTEAIRRDPRTRSVLVRGEVSGFKHHIATGHWYFSLKDPQSAVSCVMFRQANVRRTGIRYWRKAMWTSMLPRGSTSCM